MSDYVDKNVTVNLAAGRYRATITHGHGNARLRMYQDWQDESNAELDLDDLDAIIGALQEIRRLSDR